MERNRTGVIHLDDFDPTKQPADWTLVLDPQHDQPINGEEPREDLLNTPGKWMLLRRIRESQHKTQLR